MIRILGSLAVVMKSGGEMVEKLWLLEVGVMELGETERFNVLSIRVLLP